MYIATCLEVNLIASIVLLLVYFRCRVHAHDVAFSDMRFFRQLLLGNIMMLVLDTVMLLCAGRTSAAARLLCPATVFLYYIVYALFCSLWMLYWDAKLSAGAHRSRKVLFLPVLLAFLLVIFNLFLPLIYRIDEGDNYVSGPYHGLTVILNFFYLLYPTLCVLFRSMHHKEDWMQRKLIYNLLFFDAVMLLCVVLQYRMPGFNFLWTGSAVALFVFFTGLQNEQIDTDPLTGLYNRHRLMRYINACLLHKEDGKTPYIIMADMDDFKAINDGFGHTVGDDALREAARILHENSAYADFVARYGGDEFVIVTRLENDVEAQGMLRRIYEAFKRFNDAGEAPYRLRISLGASAWSAAQYKNAEEFLKKADAQMYAQKAARKRRAAGTSAEGRADKTVDKR